MRHSSHFNVFSLAGHETILYSAHRISWQWESGRCEDGKHLLLLFPIVQNLFLTGRERMYLKTKPNQTKTGLENGGIFQLGYFPTFSFRVGGTRITACTATEHSICLQRTAHHRQSSTEFTRALLQVQQSC